MKLPIRDFVAQYLLYLANGAWPQMPEQRVQASSRDPSSMVHARACRFVRISTAWKGLNDTERAGYAAYALSPQDKAISAAWADLKAVQYHNGKWCCPNCHKPTNVKKWRYLTIEEMKYANAVCISTESDAE